MRNNLIWHYFFFVCWHLSLPISAHIHPPTEQYGVITSLRGKTLNLSSISCARKSNALMLFKAPNNTKQIIANLDYNPKTQVTHIPLQDITRINIPYPYAVWYYRHNNGVRKGDKYLLIEITLQNGTITAYLIKHKTRIHGMRIRSGDAYPCSISFNAMKKIEFNNTTNMTETNL